MIGMPLSVLHHLESDSLLSNARLIERRFRSLNRGRLGAVISASFDRLA